MQLAISSILLLRAAMCLASLVMEKQSSNKNAFFDDEHKFKLKDIISNYKYDASKNGEGAVEIPAALSQFFNIFNDNEEKSWSSPTSSICVSPGYQCTADYRTVIVKQSKDLNNEHGSSSCTGCDSIRGWISNGWSGSSSNSPTSKTCCNGDICTNGVCCTPAPASSTHSICKTNSDCCGFLNGLSQCSTALGICLLTLGTTCNSTNQCISGICDGGTCCYPTGTCMPSNVICTSDKQCCRNGVCQNGTCLASVKGSCCADSDCVSPNKCIMGTCTACGNAGASCSAAAPCCPGTNSICNSMTNMCGNCQGIGGSCTQNPDTCCDNINNFCDGTTCTAKKFSGSCVNSNWCHASLLCISGMCCVPTGASCLYFQTCCNSGQCPISGPCH